MKVLGERIKALLRITVSEQREGTGLKLEGRISGIWASEFERTWRELATKMDSNKLRVDLRGVTHMDAQGKRVLADIYRKTKADFLADTPLTRHFAEEAQRGGAEGKKEEE